MKVAKQAGLDHIDYLLITHFHEDHVGDVPNLAKRIHIDNFIDHGTNRETAEAATQQGFERYQAVLAHSNAKHILAHPGETIPLTGLTATIVSADGNVLDTPLPGAGQPNPYCKNCPTRPPDQTENARSVGIVLQYGKMRLVDLGDLTWDKEMQLMCPDNKLGQMDAVQSSRIMGGIPAAAQRLSMASLRASPSWTMVRPRAALLRRGTPSRNRPA